MRRLILVLALFLALAPPASAATDLWLGYGAGLLSESGLHFGQGNSHLLGGFAWSRRSGGPAIRIFRGSLERTDIPVHGDNDLDYYAADMISRQGWLHLPFAIGIGIGHYQQAHAVQAAAGGVERRFERVWGPHVAFNHHWSLTPRWSTWAELDVHEVPLTPSVVVVTADLGLTWHITRR